MSEKHLKAYLEAPKPDAGLQEKLKAAADAEAVVEIAKVAGLEISAEELKQDQTAELSGEELEVAAGGAFTATYGNVIYFVCNTPFKASTNDADTPPISLQGLSRSQLNRALPVGLARGLSSIPVDTRLRLGMIEEYVP